MMTPADSSQSPSVPRRYRAPRTLAPEEFAALRRAADILIPATDEHPAATGEAGFDDLLPRALDARADAFDAIVAAAAAMPTGESVESFLRGLHDGDPQVFQALSAVIAEAWLLTPAVRERIGYHGQQRHPAGFEDAANDLGDGILDPVVAMEDEHPGRWAR